MIAHKLETAVKFSDRVLVMDKGAVDSFDTPSNLLSIVNKEITSNGIFAEMVKSMSIA